MFRQLFDAESHTYTYILGDPATGRALLIDPVLGQEDRDLQILEEMGLHLEVVVETHVHADHVTAAATLKDRTGCAIAYPSSGRAEGADRYLDHREVLQVGSIALETRHTPGHTAGSASYVDHAHGRVFTGDTLLIRGCGRTDFQEGDAETLYRSVHDELFTLPDDTLVYPGHDYRGRTASSIAEEKVHNPRLGGGRDVRAFVAIMRGLDLSYPKKIDVAVPANLKLGRMPDPWSALQRNARGALQAPVAWVRDQADAVKLVDVREPDEYTGPLGHVPDTTLVPLGTLEAAARSWDRDAPIVLICRSGGRSDRGALVLEMLGFTRVASMTGGTLAYNGTPPAATCG